MFCIQERQLGHYARAALVDGGSRYHNAPPCRLASKVRQIRRGNSDPAILQPGRVSCSRRFRDLDARLRPCRSKC